MLLTTQHFKELLIPEGPKKDLIMVLRNATVSTINSGNESPLTTDRSLGQNAVDHGLCQLTQGSQKRADWIQCKVFDFASFPMPQNTKGGIRFIFV